MPYKSEIINNILYNNLNLLDEMCDNMNDKCIVSDFNILKCKQTKYKSNFFHLILNNLDLNIKN